MHEKSRKAPVQMLGRHGAEPRGLALMEFDRALPFHQRLQFGLGGLYGSGGGGSSTAKFGRMFDLPPAAHSIEDILALGRAMAQPKPAGSSNLPAGFTYFGQFVDHDITRDQTSLPEAESDPLALSNFRTPAFDLDSLYGGGPAARPDLYETDKVTLKLGVQQASRAPNTGDLPRDAAGAAIIGDDRNDENLVVAQLHLTFIRFHNQVVEWFRSRGTPHSNLFTAARRAVLFHYQWVVVEDFLKRIVDPTIVADILANGRRFYLPTGPKPFMPVEFSVAAYRFGHSAIREKYAFQIDDPDGPFKTASLGELFTFTEAFAKNSPNRTVADTDWPLRPGDWRSFFELSSGHPPQMTEVIDTRLAPTLANLPGMHDPANPDAANLGVRNLVRGMRYGLPSGQSVAALMGVTPLTVAEVKGGDVLSEAIATATPLWFYILREAQIQGGGNRLGAVGGRIVAEVFLGLLQLDSLSYLNYSPFKMVTPIPFIPTPFPFPFPGPLPGPRPLEFDVASLLAHTQPRQRFDELLHMRAIEASALPLAHFGRNRPVHELKLDHPLISKSILKFLKWKPFLGSTPGKFTLADLVRFAHQGP